jgi:hypothetical protein
MSQPKAKPSEVKTVSLEVVPPASMEIVPVDPRLQRIQELVGLIEEGHKKITLLRKDFDEITLDAANETRATGIYLIELKEAAPHGAWYGMFTGVEAARVKCTSGCAFAFSFSLTTARNYMRFAKAKPETLTLQDIEGKKHKTEVMIACGAVQQSKKSGEKLHEKPTVIMIFSQLGMDWNVALANAKKTAPQEDWDHATVDVAKMMLKPIVDFYHSL